MKIEKSFLFSEDKNQLIWFLKFYQPVIFDALNKRSKVDIFLVQLSASNIHAHPSMQWLVVVGSS